MRRGAQPRGRRHRRRGYRRALRCRHAGAEDALAEPHHYVRGRAASRPILPAMPISVGDSRTFHRAIMASSMPEIMETCQRGMVDYTFLGGAQIDMYGNINSTMIGDKQKPKVRFPGPAGPTTWHPSAGGS